MNKGYTAFCANHWYIIKTDSARLTKAIITQLTLATCRSDIDRQMCIEELKDKNIVDLVRKYIKPCRVEQRSDGLYHLEVGKVDRPNTIGNYEEKDITIIEEA